jgi:large subunit ribosomal protein L22
MTVKTAKAVARNIRISPQKLNLVASYIRNMKVSEALVHLKFLRKRCAKDVAACVKSALHNAEFNHGLDIDRLVVIEATVGKSIVMKRFTPRGRGRGARVNKFFSNLYITLKEEV